MNDGRLLDLDEEAPHSELRSYAREEDSDRLNIYDNFLGSEPYNDNIGTYQAIDDNFVDNDDFYNAQPTALDSSSFDTRPVRRSGIAAGKPGLAGVYDRVKDAFGVRKETDELDLPLNSRAQDRRNADRQRDQRRPLETISSSLSKYTFGLSNSKPDPSTLGPRVIHLNNAPANSAGRYVNNHVSTAKYNAFTFFPKFLFEQFSRYANLFFLLTSMIQQVPSVSPTNRYTTIITLAVVLLVSACKELIEDVKRHKSDSELNNSPANVLSGSGFDIAKWVNIRVGDIVKVGSGGSFPADLILLASSEPEGLCYIETANLDGETNLKVKQALPETANIVNPGDIAKLSGRLRSEQPNSNLYNYEGTISIGAGGGERELPLSPEQLLLRGAILRNTQWIYGIVIFTGHETKLMRNATAAPIKRTDVERRVNVQIIFLFIILIVLSIISSAGDVITQAVSGGKFGYLMQEGTSKVKLFFADILTYWVLYSNLVPISLFVTIEMVKYLHAYMISSDLDMYYEERDIPAICRTSSLVEELGQIEYIFSDKTGTLTCNQMQFRQCSIAGICYGSDIPEDRRATIINGQEVGVHEYRVLHQNLVNHPSRHVINEFLTLLATCHTVIPDMSEEKGEIKYQAASPDEGALVEGAASLGYKFVTRRPKSISVLINAEECQYEVLNICEFNSTRKRMSAIIRCPDGKIRLYCKGADTVILERLSADCHFVDETLQHLEEYASDGLRTLCLAMREVSDVEYRQWSAVFDKAATTINNRSEELDKAAELIETNMYLLGATAIEDKLQDGVPDTIHTLQMAGIKIWVLTGDRQETAINIGMSCKLISEDMNLLLVNETSKEATRLFLTQKLRIIEDQRADLAAEFEVIQLQSFANM